MSSQHSWKPSGGAVGKRMSLEQCSKCGMERRYRNPYSIEDGHFYRRQSWHLWSWSPDNQVPPCAVGKDLS